MKRTALMLGLLALVVLALTADARAGCACSKVKSTEETSALFAGFTTSASILLAVPFTLAAIAYFWFKRVLSAAK